MSSIPGRLVADVVSDLGLLHHQRKGKTQTMLCRSWLSLQELSRLRVVGIVLQDAGQGALGFVR